MKFSIMDFFSKCDRIRSFLRIWSHLLKKSLTENFHILYSVIEIINFTIESSLFFQNRHLEGAPSILE